MKIKTNKMAERSDVLKRFRQRFSRTSNDTVELGEALRNILPFEDYKVVFVDGNRRKFKAVVECKQLDSDDAIKLFMKNYNQKTSETVRKLTPKFPSKQNPFYKYIYFRCHHKTNHEATMDPCEVLSKNPSRRFKNTNYPFSLAMKFKRDTSSEFGAVIGLEWTHNHPVKAFQSLSFTDINDDTCQNIIELFEKGYSPSLTYRELVREIKLDCANDMELHLKMSDRSKMPRRSDFNNLYTQHNRKKYGTRDLKAMFKNLEGEFVIIYSRFS